MSVEYIKVWRGKRLEIPVMDYAEEIDPEDSEEYRAWLGR